MAHLGDAGQRRAKKPLAKSIEKLPQRHFQFERWILIPVGFLLLAVWEWKVRTGNWPALFFPAPTTIAGTLWQLTINGELAFHLEATFRRLLPGFVMGGTSGFVLGLAMGWSARLRAAIDPIIAALHPIPKLSLLPLMIIIFGFGEPSNLAIVAIGTFFPMLISAMAGVRQIDPVHVDVARNYGANTLAIFTQVVIPGSLGMILTGVRLALNMALLLTITVELMVAQEGLGELIWFAWQVLRVDEMYASLIVVAALGVGFNLLIKGLTRWLVPWQDNETHVSGP